MKLSEPNAKEWGRTPADKRGKA